MPKISWLLVVTFRVYREKKSRRYGLKDEISGDAHFESPQKIAAPALYLPQAIMPSPHLTKELLMTTQHAEQNGDSNVLDALARVEPGYIEITRPDGAVDYLLVTDFEIGPNFVVSVGFANDRPDAEGNRGKPVFLHKRMQIRHLGMAEVYLDDPFVHQVIATFDGKYPAEKGLMPLLRTVELVRSGRALLADVPELLATFLR